MVTIKTYKQEKSPLKMMLIGGPGTGKTTLASTLPSPLFICTENGLLSIADKEPLYVEAKNLLDLKEVLNLLHTHFKDPTASSLPKIESIVVDSLSEMAEAIKASLTLNGTKSMSMREWGILGDQLMGIYRQLIALPCNVVFVTHDKDEKDENTGAISQGIALAGRAKDEVLRLLDIAAVVSVNPDRSRTVSVQESQTNKAKCRSNALKAVETLPLDLSQWIEIINEGVQTSSQVPSHTPHTESYLKALNHIQNTLLEDNSEDKKKTLRQMINDSKNLSEEEKEDLKKKVEVF